MGIIKGQNEFRKFKAGKSLTRKQAILAQCYECNGYEESQADCITYSCPLYQYSPYGDRFRPIPVTNIFKRGTKKPVPDGEKAQKVRSQDKDKEIIDPIPAENAVLPRKPLAEPGKTSKGKVTALPKVKVPPNL